MALQTQSSFSASSTDFDQWTKQWMGAAAFTGRDLLDPAERIKGILEKWERPIPGQWERGIDEQLLGPRYRRSDFNRPNPGEHTIEHEILDDLESVNFLGGRVVDGVNAMPLSRDETGGRRGNVEADMLLLVEKGGSYCLAVCEVKCNANNSWYAAVECLRQMKLLQSSLAARQLFHHRLGQRRLPSDIPMIGLVVAPEPYYRRTGQLANAVPHARQLSSQFMTKTGVGLYLTTWDAASRSISEVR